jgi:hypothetical protein
VTSRAVLVALTVLLAAAVPARADRTLAVDASGGVHAFVVGSDGALYHAPPGGSLTRLGGTLAQEPVAAARSADGRPAVFARGTDNALYWTIQAGASWSAWIPLGTQLAGPPAALVNSDGRLEVFARGAGNVIHHAYELMPGGAWSGWVALATAAFAGDPVGIRDGLGRLTVFARGFDAAAYVTWQAPTASGWAPWTTLDGGMIGDPAVANNADNRLETFVHGTDNRLWHGYQEGGPTGVWRRWFTLGHQIVGNPAATRGPQGRLHVFARGTDNALWHLYQEPPGAGWGQWRSLGGQFSGDPQVITDGLGLLYVVAPAASGELLTVRQNSAQPEDFGAFSSLGRAVPPAAEPVPTATPTPVAPSSTPVPAPRLRTINVTLSFSHTSSRRSTRFSRLQVKGVPRGSTVRATCAKGCSRASYVKRNARGTLSLLALARKALKVGTRIRVEVTAPNMIGAVKVLTVRSRNDPSITTRCLQPGARRDSPC